jgi:hypothetical protein
MLNRQNIVSLLPSLHEKQVLDIYPGIGVVKPNFILVCFVDCNSQGAGPFVLVFEDKAKNKGLKSQEDKNILLMNKCGLFFS